MDKIDRLAVKTVKKIISELNGRRGFDDWWENIDERIAHDIKGDLVILIREALKEVENVRTKAS